MTVQSPDRVGFYYKTCAPTQTSVSRDMTSLNTSNVFLAVIILTVSLANAHRDYDNSEIYQP